METKFQTSFIPKKPVMGGEPSRSGSMSLLLLVSIIIFLVSIGMAGYVFLEKNLLIQKLAADQNTIETNKSGLVSDSITIESLVELDSRTNVAKTLLDKHIAVSPVFDFLQKVTLVSVKFNNFTFSSASPDASGVSKVSIQMSGQARDWETVASQADEFGKPEWKKVISEPKISNLSLNADGSVSFIFTSFVAPVFLIYGSNTNN